MSPGVLFGLEQARYEINTEAGAAAAEQLGRALTSWANFTGIPAGFPWLWCHPLVVDGPAGDVPVPMPTEESLRALAGVGAVADFPMWELYGPGILQHADEQVCARAQSPGTPLSGRAHVPS